MPKADQFRQYAEEALRWARQSKTEKEKQAYTNLALTWMQAARSTPLPNKPAAGMIVRWLNCLDVDVGQTPAQCCRDDQNHGDHAEVSGLLSSRRMLPHFSIHLELSLKLLRHNLQPMLLARPSAV